MADQKKFALKIITPDRIFYEGNAEMVEFNTTEGEIGVYADHVPMTVIVNPGILTITDEEDEKIAALHAGFVEILEDKVTILAEIVEWPNEIDGDRAEEALERAKERLSHPDEELNVMRAETALQRAITRIHVIK